jgi:transcriptional regulator with XRE-family HTH domain
MKVSIGEKIKTLRLASDLTQAELASRARLTRGFISQIENDQSSINLDSLADILEALGVNLGEFFSDAEQRRIVFRPTERVNVEGKGATKFELLMPGSTNNLMDPILLELQPGEFLPMHDPMPGEQFGFVLAGSLTLKIDGKSYKVPKDHCFYFKSDQRHQMGNAGERITRLLWVTTPPQM